MTDGGDEFNGLYQREVKRVWHYFRRRGVSEVDTADLVQEVFVRTYSGWEKFVPDNRTAWLFGFVWRVYCEHIRKRVREVIGGDLDELAAEAGHDERSAFVVSELDKLKQDGTLTPLAEQVLNGKLQGKPEREIALELGEAAWQVREAYEKVVQELRARLLPVLESGAAVVEASLAAAAPEPPYQETLEPPESSPSGGHTPPPHRPPQSRRAQGAPRSAVQNSASETNLRRVSKIDAARDTHRSRADVQSADEARVPSDSGCYLKPELEQATPPKRLPHGNRL